MTRFLLVILSLLALPGAALAQTKTETAIFAGGRLAMAYGAGYWFGTQVRSLIVAYAPGLDNAIGAGVASVVDSLTSAVDYVTQGQLEQDLDDLFDSPIYDSGDYDGDFGVSDAMDSWIDAGGGGCLIDEECF